jgi:hypothetical protein
MLISEAGSGTYFLYLMNRAMIECALSHELWAVS